MDGQLGVIAPGAYADLIVVDGDPLKDIGVLTDPQRYLKLVMKAGEVMIAQA
jgi:imidazolonepropionase-like amidohydrolase